MTRIRKSLTDYARPVTITVLIALTIAMPWLVNDYILFLLTLIGTYLVATQGLNLLMGFAGQISLGHAGFCAIGAYVTGYAHARAGWPFWIALALGLGASALVGLCLGYLCLEMAGPYLALTTLAFGIIVQTIARNWRNMTGGPDGLTPLPPPIFGPIEVRTRVQFYLMVMVIVWVLTFLMRNIVNSRVGRALMAVRDDSIAASGLGVDVVFFRVIAFTVSAVLAALSGVLMGYLSGGIFPDFFDRRLSSVFIVALMMGGRATVVGPVIGCLIVVSGFEVLRGFREYQMMVYSLIVILVVIYMPGGFMQLVGIVQNMIAKILTARSRRHTPSSLGEGGG